MRYPFRGFGRVKMVGARSIYIGKNTVIGDGTWLNVNEPHTSTINIGNDCLIGLDNFFSAGKMITIEDYFLSGARCSFICSSHHIEDVTRPYLKTGTTKKHEIHIGKNVFFGYNVSVVGNVTIGTGSVIGANSVVLDDIPNYAIAIGNPARVIKRFDFVEGRWVRSNDMSSYDEKDVDFKGKFYMPITAVKREWNIW